MLRRFLSLLGLAAFIGLGSSVASAQPWPHYGPPPPRYEYHGHAPYRGAVWVGGYHRWYGGRYVWVAGHWAHPPHYGAVWYPGHYANRGGVYIWIGGHWG
jgi:hypothetical protein